MKKKEKYEEPVYQPPRILPMNITDIISTDPMGCYTGIVEDAHDIPVQDADDL